MLKYLLLKKQIGHIFCFVHSVSLRHVDDSKVQLYPGQDAHRVQQVDEDQEPDQPGQHPLPRPEGGLQQLSLTVPGKDPGMYLK